MEQKFKVGDKVRVVKTIHTAVFNDYKIGDIFKVDSVQDYALTTIGGPRLWYEEVEKVTKKTERISALESQVAELTAKVQALGKSQKPATIKAVMDEVAQSIEKAHATPTPKSPNEQRKAIIAEAKAFVAEFEADSGTLFMSSEGGNLTKLGHHYTVFHVNTKKRVVTALVYGKYDRELAFKGIAKCAPDDVFNADIGKAIALGRALGLDVKRFEQAVKPTEFVVGMLVKAKKDSSFGDTPFTVDSIDREFVRDEPGNGWIYDTVADILDDTDAQY